MANMSYCRFENTLRDLFDCLHAMDDGTDYCLSETEATAKKKLIRLCIEIAKEYGPDAVSNALYHLREEQLS